MTGLIKIDGSSGEGGGQILRTALALSILTQKPFEITGIRALREKQGLKNQHLYVIKSLCELSNSKVEGAYLGSTDLKFYPGEIKSKNLLVDIETAGSITLVLQSLILPCIFADGKIKLKLIGGTDTKWSPQVDYFRYVFLSHMRRFAEIEFKLEKRGYFPLGGGLAEIIIKPKSKFNELDSILSFNLIDQGNLMQIKGVSHASSALKDAQVADRQTKSAKINITKPCPVTIETEYVAADCIGSGISLFAVFSKDKENIDILNPIILGADVLGEKGVTSEKVGEICAKKLIYEIDSLACVDEHLCDHLMPYLALIGGKIKTSKISSHTKTNITICELFLDVKFEIDETKKIISVNKLIKE